MPTMNVSVTLEMADFVESEVANGDYASASELVRDALRLMRRDLAIEAEKIELLRRHLQVSIDQMERREFSAKSVADIAAEILAEPQE
jgi:antitoxin ParD1/3/4